MNSAIKAALSGSSSVKSDNAENNQIDSSVGADEIGFEEEDTFAKDYDNV